MKTLSCSLLFCTIFWFANGQNLVIDGGLEDTIKCPQSIGRFYHPTNTNEQYTAQWRATTLASPDYHNECGYTTFQPRNGSGYAGILYYDPSEYREYITALLSQPLVAGEQYYLEYYVALNAGSTQAINEIQVHFSNGVPLDMTFPPPGPLALVPHLQESSPVTNTAYQKISGCYTATGGEYAITFGNFYDNANTTLTTVSASGSVNAYYFIDDVSLIHLDTSVSANGATLTADMIGATYQWIDCENNNANIPGSTNQSYTAANSGNYAVVVTIGDCSDTSSCYPVDLNSVQEIGLNSIAIYPNPVSDELHVSWSGDVQHVQLSDSKGRIIYSIETNDLVELSIDTKQLDSGIYQLTFTNESGSLNRKIIKK